MHRIDLFEKTQNTADQKRETHNAGERQMECVRGFIDDIWNAGFYERMYQYLHPDFVDYSMPSKLFQNQNGLFLYLKQMAKTVSHRTELLDTFTLDELVICKIRITISETKQMNSAGMPSEVISGYRIFQMHEHKIIAHWEVI